MHQPLRPADLAAVPTMSIRERQSRLCIEQLAAPLASNSPMLEFLNALPKTGLAEKLNSAVRDVREAAQRNHPVIAMVGSKVYESGYSPLVISLMEKGIISSLGMDGRSALFDFELGYYGRTDEESEPSTYGSAREVGETFNHIINEGVPRGFGIGEFLGRSLLERSVKHIEYSVLAHGSAKRIPITVHPLIGADPIHRSASANGAHLGKGAHRDLLIFMGQLQGIANGGIILDLWSDGLHGVFEQSIAAAFQASRQALTDWQYVEFRERQDECRSGWRDISGVKVTSIEGDPLLLALLCLGIF